ncbi:hypothetical protein BJX66DRAFT_302374 [Aspergillus keveii]|uniref:Uncharacterized protein n=1 Tax=Aspergillus keveii TaxID=714993 RepID=A0ABR4G830_9EURO
MACFFECDEEATFHIRNQEMPISTRGAEAYEEHDPKITSLGWEMGEQIKAANSEVDEDQTSSHNGEEIPFLEFVEKNGLVAWEDMETGSDSRSSEPSAGSTNQAINQMTLFKSSTLGEEEELLPSPEIGFVSEAEFDGLMAPEQEPDPDPEHLALEMQLARGIAERFRGRPLVVLLLGDRREEYIEGGYWRVTNEPLLQNGEDMFLGLILLRQTHEDGRRYWQRLGVCHWRSLPAGVIPARNVGGDNLDVDVILGQGPSWVDLHGIFG